MTPQLSPELQHALHAGDQTLEVVDPSTNQQYVIVRKEVWLQRGVAGEGCNPSPPSADSGPADPWTDDKNRRRAELVDREIAGTLTDQERTELELLQHQMRAYRERVAPLPIEDARRLHAELMDKAHKAQARNT